MPWPCCKLCYLKYIDNDGSLDKDRLIKCCKKRGITLGDLPFICKCDCHKDGINCVH